MKIIRWIRWYYIKWFQPHRYQAPNTGHRFNEEAFKTDTLIDQVIN
jgi:hypothetical protein